MPEELRYGIIGCAGVGNSHASAVDDADGANLIACADVSAEAAANFAEEHDVEHTFTDVPTMIEDASIDAVSVCTPSGTHADVTVEAMEAGADAIVEKPLDVYADRINRMIAAADDADVTLAGVFQRRFHPQLRRARQLVADGEIGDPILGDTRVKWYRSQGYYDSGGWRGTREMDGGCMMNQGVHDIDALQWIVGDVKSVAAMTGTLARDLDCEDTAAVALEFENGALGAIEVTTAVVGGRDGLEINGTEGSLGVTDRSISSYEVSTGEGSHYGAETTEPSIEGLPHPAGGGHGGVIQDFVDALQEGRDPEVPAREARKAVDVILAAYQSAETGDVVEVADMRSD